MGVATGASLLRLEKLARNAVQGKDVRGWQPVGDKINVSGEDILSNFPEEVFAKMADQFAGLLMVSEDAGSYLCNYLYYKSLAHFSINSKVLFVHVADVQQLPDAVSLEAQQWIVKTIAEHQYRLNA
jgi:pyroglutamyl-peptidase